MCSLPSSVHVPLVLWLIGSLATLVTGQVRIVGGPSSKEGRVEIQYNGRWGIVCDDHWDIHDANVVCRQLGYTSAKSAPHGSRYGYGSGTFHMDDVKCVGTEIALAQCPFAGWSNHNCGSTEAAGVICQSGCGGPYTGSTGIITSPNYPNKYWNNLRCTYYIRIPTNAGVYIKFSNFILENCCDYFRIGGNQYSGNKKPVPYSSSGPGVTLKFTTDGSAVYSGWRLEYGTNGAWATWSSWGSCSKTCGSGTRRRHRSCTNPVGIGLPCSGQSSQTGSCNTQVCSVDGGWSTWSGWGACSASCCAGTKIRRRQCSNPSPVGNGRNCAGSVTMRESCHLVSCPVNGNWSFWSNWSLCSLSCGGGEQTRHRNCSNPSPAFGGQNCSGSSLGKRTCNSFNCPIDGNWTVWSNWTTCSLTCGGGEQTRSRNCSNPSPAFGGQNCTGTSKENRTCNSFNCPIDGNWSAWSNWTTCSLACGGGEQTRSRNCSDPMPRFGGLNCSGENLENRTCNAFNCPINGNWSFWSNWSTCSTSCGGGEQFRKRNCSDPLPEFGGLNCSGENLENRTCNAFNCPINGNWSNWSNWAMCSLSCGGGEQTRSRNCSDPLPAFGGHNCSGGNYENRTCNAFNCPINGNWSTWSNWSSCSLSCGGGEQMRSRNCSNPLPEFGGLNCFGDNLENRTCNTFNCPVNGNWSPWSNWSSCSISCGGGEQIRSRNCSDPLPEFGGLNCSGEHLENRTCNTFDCPVNGNWSHWSNWSICSLSCGGGEQTRSRNCSNPWPAFGGQNCSGKSYENRTCNDFFCPIDGDWSLWSNWSICTLSCGGGDQTRFRNCSNPTPSFGGQNCSGRSEEKQTCNTFNCPLDGNWSLWSTWSACSRSCDGGGQTRSRSCNNPLPAFGGQNCSGFGTVNRTCNSFNCPVNGQWSLWSNWTTCTLPCGGGHQNRSRSCSNPSPAFGGNSCSGNEKETRMCNTFHCPVDGKWSGWSDWETCSLFCGGGEQNRSRSCTDPLPAFGGRNCSGTSLESRTCNGFPCPIDGKWSVWSNWSACSLSCGEGGVQTRSRVCSNPTPMHGGQNCSGMEKGNRTCNEHKCPINGQWSLWSSWETCSLSCSVGYQSRVRSCNNPLPAFGGQNCSGNIQQNRTCNTAKCPVNGQWSVWSSWSKCTKSCSEGVQFRNRSCSSPSPAYNGLMCVGPTKDNRACRNPSCLEMEKGNSNAVSSAEDGSVNMTYVIVPIGVAAVVAIAVVIVVVRKRRRRQVDFDGPTTNEVAMSEYKSSSEQQSEET